MTDAILKLITFGASVAVQLSTSQWIAFLSALLVAYYFAKFWELARKSPALAMGPASLGEFLDHEEDGGARGQEGADDDEGEASDEDAAAEDEPEASADAQRPKKVRTKGLVAKGKKKAEGAAKEDDEEEEVEPA